MGEKAKEGWRKVRLGEVQVSKLCNRSKHRDNKKKCKCRYYYWDLYLYSIYFIAKPV